MKTSVIVLTAAALFSICVLRAVNAQPPAKNSASGARGEQTAVISESIVIETSTGDLHGTLLRPKSASPMPIALIIAGSGPTDRDGNSPMLSGPNNSLKLLAEGLAARGIASLRYDKRGVGESGEAMRLAAEKAHKVLREEDLLFEAYIDDAVSWGKKLLSDRRFSSLTIIGHSEGSLIGMVAARRVGARAYVSIAGAGRPIQQIILEQVKLQFSPDLLKAIEDILNQLVAGKAVADVPAALNVLFRPSIQPYLISWFSFDPAKEIARLSRPVLIVQGTTDIQVSVQDATLLARANPSAKLMLIDGMNHVLKAVSNEKDKQIASYSDPVLPIVPNLVGEISSFIKKPTRN
ncbi:MAG: alpha/beta hydrolase [Pyrinomonadaceae bacterium]